MGSEPKRAGFLVPKPVEHRRHERPRLVPPHGIERGLMHVQHRIDGHGVIFGEAFERRPTVCMPGSSKLMGLAGHARHVLQKRCALNGPVHPFGTSHPTARLGESGNRQGCPRGQDLVVQPGLRSSRSRTVPPFGHLLQRILDSGDLGGIGPQRRIAFRRPSQDVHALLPQAAPVQVKHGLNVLLHGRVRQCGRHIGFAPHVVQSLCAVAVRIQGGF